ncbi:universal stress protein [Capilliphycus salinus ALCB114379]|uniref:universal stress protein n=1 Tax=Capilliphycus salinus TaxID=2768948 RepID=UPI0039A4763B
MFTKILVAIDLSTVSESLFEKALSLAKFYQAELMLLHVLSHDEQGSPIVEGITGLNYYEMVELETIKSYKKRWQEYIETGLERLTTYATQATEAGVASEYSQPMGKPGHQICEAAKEWNADLIIIGRRGYSGLSELILGSVSNYTLHHAHCSVLIVQ